MTTSRSIVPVRALSRGPLSHFFGYYDKCPWEGDGGARVLCHETPNPGQPPQPEEPVSIGYVRSDGAGRFVPVGESRAWNFQQGAMLQWLPGRAGRIAYNDMRGGRPVAVLSDVDSGERTVLDEAIAAVSPTGEVALSLNFGRLARLRPDYGYAGAGDPFEAEPCPAGDGVRRVDLKDHASELLLPLSRIAACEADPRFEGGTHWANHLQFSPRGTRFCFVHRVLHEGGNFHSRLMIARADGSELRVLIAGVASHACWLDDDRVVAWAGERKAVGAASAALPVLPLGRMLRFGYRFLGKPAWLKSRVLGDGLFVFGPGADARERLESAGLASDGHFTFSPDRRWMVTDTYADRLGWASVLLHKLGTERLVEVGSFWSPPGLDDEVRCDLHPRWSPDGRKVCIDSAHEGARQMYELDVTDLVTA
ncbi:MAG: hypothetical protein AMK73_01485 [Planctomycetes bacterium SM23_32]|nr:MAG: hypothetical protein AMK73_01485 [Planctomycetes bacterium SM23_32]